MSMWGECVFQSIIRTCRIAKRQATDSTDEARKYIEGCPGVILSSSACSTFGSLSGMMMAMTFDLDFFPLENI